MSNEPTPSSEQPTDHAPESVEANTQDASLPETDHSESDQPNEASMDADSHGNDSIGGDEAESIPESDGSDASDTTDKPEDDGHQDEPATLTNDSAPEEEASEEESSGEEVSGEEVSDGEPEPLTDMTTAAAETADPDGAEDDVDESEGDGDSTAEAEPSAPSPPASSPSPTPEPAPASTLGKVKSGAVWVLQTVYQGLDWAFVQLKSDAQPEAASTGDQEAQASPSAAKKIEGVLAQVLRTVAIALTTALSFVIGTALKLLGASPQPTSAESTSPSSPIGGIASALWGIVWPILKQLWRLWRRLLAILRERLLPDSIKPLSDVTLTLVAVGIVYSISWLTSAISPEPKAPPPASSPSVAVSTDAQPAKVSPATAKRIATIQEDLSEATRSYGDDFVQMVQIIPGGDRLTVTLDWDWYRLNSRQQDQLSKTLLKTAQEFDFESLEVLDIDGTRVARSPVIGSTMIVFKRTSEKLEELDRIAAEKAAAEKAAAEKAAAEKAAAEKAAAEKAAVEKELDINSDASPSERSVSPDTLENNES